MNTVNFSKNLAKDNVRQVGFLNFLGCLSYDNLKRTIMIVFDLSCVLRSVFLPQRETVSSGIKWRNDTGHIGSYVIVKNIKAGVPHQMFSICLTTVKYTAMLV